MTNRRKTLDLSWMHKNAPAWPIQEHSERALACLKYLYLHNYVDIEDYDKISEKIHLFETSQKKTI